MTNNIVWQSIGAINQTICNAVNIRRRPLLFGHNGSAQIVMFPLGLLVIVGVLNNNPIKILF